MKEVHKPASVENKPIAPDQPTQQAQYKLDGAWYGASRYDVSEIGPNNFQTLKNMRYAEKHPEGVQGYTKTHSATINANYDNLRQGVQLRTGRDYDYMLVLGHQSSSDKKIYYSTDTVPTTTATYSVMTTGRSGGGSGSAYNDTTGNYSTLAKITRNHIVYSNSEESYIWAGSQMDIAACFLCDDSDLANPRDYYDQMRNTLSDSSNVMAVDSADEDVFTVHSTRPLQGVWFTVSSANASAATLSCHVWTGSWTAVGNASDGTSSSGKALAQSGLYAFDSTVSTAVRKHVEGTYFYCYRFTLSAGSASISNIQVDAPFQKIVDIWDGVPRESNFVAFDDGDIDDRTAHVVDSSTGSTPIGLDISAMSSTDEIYIMLESEQATAVQVTMLADRTNGSAAVLTGKYWDGDSWAAMSNLSDGTTNGTDAFNQSGLISWEPSSSEKPRNLNGKFGYAYRFSITGGPLDGSSDNNDVVVDTVRLIPAPLTVGPYRFHDAFKGRHLGVGAITSNESNRIDFTAPYAPDVWNGSFSSAGGINSVYMDTDEVPNCGTSLYNRYGTREFEVYVVFTNSNMFQLKESDQEGVIYDIDKISNYIGCPAPRTLVSTGIGLDISQYEAKRGMLLWVDASGPYYYDGSIPVAIPGIERYFDPNDSLYVGANLTNAFSWIDPVYKEWNLVLPASNNGADKDVWVVWDMEKKKWYEKDTGDAEVPLSGWTVTGSNGDKYTYGGISGGFVVRLEYGNTWSGESIRQEWMCGDFWPSENIWHQTVITRFKLVAKKIDETHDLQIVYSRDTEGSVGANYVWHNTDTYEWYDTSTYEWYSPTITTLALYSDQNERLVRTTPRLNLIGWCHAFGGIVSTDDTNKGFQPIGWGIEYRKHRDDY